MVEIKENIANKKNYGAKRVLSDIKYIVIHYTAVDGDSDENEGKYFHNNIVSASAHYFVDSDSITRSVPDDYVAYSVGGSKYKNDGGRLYKICTNSNSLSIELCDDYKNGVIYPSAATIQNALDLVKDLMDKYKVPASNVIRHYDVNGKPCPAYWVDDVKWEAEFHSKIVGSTPQPTPSKVPSLALPTVKKGDRGSMAKYLQQDLNYVMKSGLVEDGIFGTKSDAALREFQRKYGLTVDGIYGNNSKNKMKSLLV